MAGAYQTGGFAYQGAGQFAYQGDGEVIDDRRPGTDGTRRRRRHAERDEIVSWELADARQKRRLAEEKARREAAKPLEPVPELRQSEEEQKRSTLVLASRMAYMERMLVALEADEQVRAMADAIAAKRKERDRIAIMMMMAMAMQ